MFFNPSDEWINERINVFQDLPQLAQEELLKEASVVTAESAKANSAGKAATRVWPETAVRLDNGGLAFFSQLGVARRPDLTQYFIDGFPKNRDALAFSEDSQSLFAEVFAHIAERMNEQFEAGEGIVQSDSKSTWNHFKSRTKS